MMCKHKKHKLCVQDCENGCKREKAKPIKLFEGMKIKRIEWAKS